ncbi:MAG: hypothetical protein ABSH01_28025, partial [Terriglobia bacterium]
MPARIRCRPLPYVYYRNSRSVYSGCVAPMACPTNSVTPDPTTNRISGDCYDANGNLLAESAPPCPSPAYTFDAENHLVNSCLSGCFSKPQLVVYGHAAPSVCENLTRVPVDVLYRR